MELSSAVPVLPAADLQRAKTFYAEKLGMPVTDGIAGLTIGEGVNRLFVYPGQGTSPGTFTQAALQVKDVSATVANLKAQGIAFEDVEVPGIKTVEGIAHMPDGDDAAWFKDSEGNLLVVVPNRE
jgi:catechol 2,3-dioxygenase-like lactoylglutathione lyase family enzyme